MEQKLTRLKRNRQQTLLRGVRYPGEIWALAATITMVVTALVVAGILTGGLGLILLSGALLALVRDHYALRKSAAAVTESTYPELHRLVRLAAFRLRVLPPSVFVTQAPAFNAYATGLHTQGNIILHSSLLEGFTPAELTFVLGHELTHIVAAHTTWLRVLAPLQERGGGLAIGPLLGPMVSFWRLRSEYTADRGGLLSCGSLSAAINCLVKLTAGLDAARQTELLKTLESQENSGVLSDIAELQQTHPFLANRIRNLRKYHTLCMRRYVAQKGE